LELVFEDIVEFASTIKKTDILIGIDYGQKKIGLAISSPSRNMALPLAILLNNQKTTFNDIKTISLAKNIGGFIVGIPINMDSSHGESAIKAKNFAIKLSAYTNLPIFLQDERRTSKAADSLLMIAGFNRKQRNSMDDSIAAALILESALHALTHSNW
jgi:putative Holliday junction resolvase